MARCAALLLAAALVTAPWGSDAGCPAPLPCPKTCNKTDDFRDFTEEVACPSPGALLRARLDYNMCGRSEGRAEVSAGHCAVVQQEACAGYPMPPLACSNVTMVAAVPVAGQLHGVAAAARLLLRHHQPLPLSSQAIGFCPPRKLHTGGWMSCSPALHLCQSHAPRSTWPRLGH
eukprot:TRINITY_DN37876_c0_g1_i1.p1 TRINITY_DN37876_c0_g1~~TRINITY_DN37876_c0_g1_i1.p1  ORF type:complete len:198 (+),score=23.04 TRINITY_DN37876_c0_g1_i1:74-595(+)